MRIIIAPDKFKGTLTGLEFCNAVEEGIKSVNSNAEIVKLPLADGGDGTIDVANYYLKGEFIKVKVNNPLFREIEAQYLFSDGTKTAFIEMAEASGLRLLDSAELDCKNTTTYGTGQLILDAIKKGATQIILGIGGSATNDCGIGMATALGYRFLDKDNNEVNSTGKELSKIVAIDTSKVNAELKKVTFKIACDVTNPLYGKNGAAYVYAEQKGASTIDIEMLDEGLKDFSKVLFKQFNIDPQEVNGAGAAGGMGIGTMLFLNGALEPGIQLIKDLVNFDNQIEGADWIITGEGKLDTQTMSGKTIQGVLSSAKIKKIKVAAFCGAIDLEDNDPEDLGIHYTDAVMNYAKNLEDAMENSYAYVKEISKEFTCIILK